MQNEKEDIKLFLIADNMMIYAENSNEFNKKKNTKATKPNTCLSISSAIRPT